MMLEKLTYDEFRAYALLYAAHADGHYASEEEILIKSLLPPNHYESVKAHFDTCSDADVIDLLIAHSGQYCGTPEARSLLQSEMLQICRAHKSFSQIERAILQLCKRIFA